MDLPWSTELNYMYIRKLTWKYNKYITNATFCTYVSEFLSKFLILFHVICLSCMLFPPQQLYAYIYTFFSLFIAWLPSSRLSSHFCKSNLQLFRILKLPFSCVDNVPLTSCASCFSWMWSRMSISWTTFGIRSTQWRGTWGNYARRVTKTGAETDTGAFITNLMNIFVYLI